MPKETTQQFKSFLSGAVDGKVNLKTNREDKPPPPTKRDMSKNFIALNKEKVTELSRRKSQDREIKEALLIENTARFLPRVRSPLEETRRFVPANRDCCRELLSSRVYSDCSSQ